MTEALAVDADVEYPTRDGRPVAETPLHYRRLADAAHALTMSFESRASAYVGVNMLVYDERGNPRRYLSPDIFVAFGVESRQRDIYKLWEDESPAFVLEVTSKTTRREDRRKKARYARCGVAECFLYDPRGEYLKPALQGFELAGDGYRAMGPPSCPTASRDSQARPSASVCGSTGRNCGSTMRRPDETCLRPRKPNSAGHRPKPERRRRKRRRPQRPSSDTGWRRNWRSSEARNTPIDVDAR